MVLSVKSEISINITNFQSLVADVFSIPAFFVASDKASFKTYSSLDALSTDEANFGDNAEALINKVSTYLAQPNASADFVVITYIAGSIVDAYNQYKIAGWYRTMLVGDPLAKDSNGKVSTDVTDLSNKMEADKFHTLWVNSTPDADYSGLASNSTAVLLAGILTGNTTDAGNQLDAALLGQYGATTIGSINWHNRGGLVGVYNAADYLTEAQFTKLNENNVITYVTKFVNTPATSLGKTASGDYIDFVEGRQWVAYQLKARLQTLLIDNDKLPMDSTGFQLVRSTVDSLLNEAWVNGVVATDQTTNQPRYTVTMLGLDNLNTSDINAHNYKGVSFVYYASYGIDSIAINGQIRK